MLIMTCLWRGCCEVKDKEKHNFSFQGNTTQNVMLSSLSPFYGHSYFLERSLVFNIPRVAALWNRKVGPSD
jgi:hypothetical protein